ncbi:MAG: hypothetical protein IJ155_03935 [Prevotella sp.]|nr:hypothetical protein [Prevotella sp.]
MEVPEILSIFAVVTKKHVIMCTYNLVLDDQLVAEAEHTLGGVSLQVWLQQQVEELLRKKVDQQVTPHEHPKHAGRKAFRVRSRAEHSPSDAELEARFAGLEMPELPEAPLWDEVIKANSGKVIKPVEKWL